MKATLLAITFSIFSLSIFAQCNTDKYTSAGAIVVEAQFEDLIKITGRDNNGNIADGFQRANARLFKVDGNWGLQIGTIATGYYFKNLIPRQVTIFFTDGTSLHLISTTYSRTESKIELCKFDISSSDISSFNKEIKSIEILDNRTGQTLKRAPVYSLIFREQLNCLQKL